MKYQFFFVVKKKKTENIEARDWSATSPLTG